MKRSYPRSSKGFTFIEISIVVVMLSAISLVIYSTLSAGVKIWQRANSYALETDVAIFLDKISQDLRNCIRFSGIPAHGSGNDLVFALLQDNTAKDAANFGIAHYYFNPQEKRLYRAYSDYSRLYSGDIQEHPTLMLENALGVAFSYYFKEEKAVWKDVFSTNLPQAVRVEVIFESNKRQKVFREIIPLYVPAS